MENEVQVTRSMSVLRGMEYIFGRRPTNSTMWSPAVSSFILPTTGLIAAKSAWS